eukprot:gene27953-36822_t
MLFSTLTRQSRGQDCGLFGGGHCVAPGDCCSMFGWCGDKYDWCGPGCQPAYGLCWSATPTQTPTQTPTIQSRFSLSGPTQFNGSTYLRYSPLSVSLGNYFSISVWVTPFAVSNAVIVSMGRSPTNSNGQFVLYFGSNGILQYFEYNNGYGVSLSSSSSSLKAGIRTHIVLVRNGINGTIFVNGVATATNNAIITNPIQILNSDLVFVNPDNTNKLAFYVYFGSVYCYYIWSTNCNDDNAHHVAWSLSPIGQWVLCVDGVCRKLSATTCTNNGYPTAKSRFWNSLGESNWYGNAYFNGHIWDFRLYSYALSAAEAQGLYLAEQTSPVTSLTPSRQPTFTASLGPTYYPSSRRPTMSPSFQQSIGPTLLPSVKPSITPSSMKPSLGPSYCPSTLRPTMSPSFQQSIGPTQPTVQPSTTTPSIKPSSGPSYCPSTFQPTVSPSVQPSVGPTLLPTIKPSTTTPSMKPSPRPSYCPSSVQPSVSPSVQPSVGPTLLPTIKPSTTTPSMKPSPGPTFLPTYKPSITPTFQPSIKPTFKPTKPAMPTKFPLNNVTTSLRRPTSSPSDISGTTSKLANAGRNSTISASTSWVIAIIVVVMVTCVAVATYCFYARDSFLKKAVSKLPFPCKKSSIFPGHNNAYAPSDENEASDSQMRYPKPQLNSAKSTIISLKFENGNVEDGIDLDRNVDENFEEFFGDLNEKVVLIQTNELKKLFKEFDLKSSSHFLGRIFI